MISVVDLRKSFVSPNGERLEVLRGVSFSAKPGETVAITGASGSGKSTLLHLLGGLETADHGTVTFNGTDGRPQQIGFVFQFHYLLSDLSAVENVALPLLIARHNSRQAHERALELLKESGLEARADHPVSHLSGGEQQRVAVARALVTEPKLLLADEPTGNLDTAIGAEIARTLVSYAHKHSGVLIIATHSAILAQMCDRTLLLENGRLNPANPV
ncbi:MAG TPA: ABC transporter ATP-binding protein [Pyrinomonadaceae bacterium]|nr:ABC transporter ATP-binding protein [Pyrinomonadaceae bacterium]